MLQQPRRDKVAVATYEGILVNQHLGMADELFIYQMDDAGCRLLDRRPTPERGGGEERWRQLGEVLADCHTLLVNGIGELPCEVLTGEGITVYEVEGLIVDALDEIRHGRTLRMPRRVCGGCRRTETGRGGGEGCGS